MYQPLVNIGLEQFHLGDPTEKDEDPCSRGD